MKSLIRSIVLVISLLVPSMLMAVPISADFTGSRSVGSGLSANDGDKGVLGWASKGFDLSWEITQVAGGYNYSYTLDPLGNGGISLFILEVSPAATATDFTFPVGFEGPKIWDSGGNIALNPPLYGIKFAGNGQGLQTIDFFSTKAPVWGDFFSKDGNFGYVWNTGFGTDPVVGGSFTNWIATPDTNGPPVPEPGTIVLLGAGLFALGIFSRRRLNK